MENSILSINPDVLEQMAAMAAMEVEGVVGMATGPVDVQALGRGKLLKSVIVSEKNGAVTLNVYIKIAGTAEARTVAENVQKSVKEKLQNMTGNAITRVNVTVGDVVFAD